jgi:hypothetical protein
MSENFYQQTTTAPPTLFDVSLRRDSNPVAGE